ncbi:MAG: hypothetical protein HFH45_05080 [Bacilli bacterium]|nr:hypothetical protein [Bacilli bacterium]
MNSKTKIIISVIVLILGISSITTYVITKNNNLDSKSGNEIKETKEKKKKDKKEEELIETTDENQIISTDSTSTESDTIASESTSKNTYKTNSTKKNHTTNSKPNTGSSATKPSKPNKPNDETVTYEDLVITNDMVNNKEVVVNDKTYENVIVAANLEENTHIILKNIDIKDTLMLANAKKYQLDIVNTKAKSMVTTQSTMAMFSLRSAPKVNKTISGPTINMDNQSSVDTLSIDGNIHINGDNAINEINIINGDEVILNVPAKNVVLNNLEKEGTLAINKTITTLINNNDNTNMIINANITDLKNESENSNIMINKNNTVTKLVSNGENTTISGNGTINSLTVNANNTKVYTKTVNKPVLNGELDRVVVRQENDITITDVKSNGQGNVTFTLSKSVDLTLDDISVICSAGKSISKFKLTQNGNTYSLSTSYFKNPVYSLYITLPNGNIISEDFSTDYANPTVNKVDITRINETEANFEIYGLDEGGYVYYLLEPNQSRTAVSADTIMKNGIKSNAKLGYNKITISNLEANQGYTLYYVIEGFYGNVASVQGPIDIDADPMPEDTNDYKITYAAEETINNFHFELNKAPSKELTLDDFRIICPTQSNLTLKGARLSVSSDRLTYIIKVPDNYGHKDNNYTVTINVDDTNTIKSTFVSHFDPPRITGETVIREDENTAIFNFNSDEPGTVYYGVYEWNQGIYDWNSTTPMSGDILSGAIASKKQTLNYGGNTINIDLSNINVTKNTRIWALFIDEVGNYRKGFVDHVSIPEYVDQTDPDEKALHITNATYNNGIINVTFSEAISSIGATSEDIELQVISGGSISGRIAWEVRNNYDSNEVSFKIINGVSLTPGTYKIILKPYNKDDNRVVLEKEFTIN